MQVDTELVLGKLRKCIASKGATCLRGLSKVFRQLDSFDGNNKVDREEFVLGIRKLGLVITEKDSLALFAGLDKNGDGFLDFEEFLVAIRGRPNEVRMEVILESFNKFDLARTGVISIEDLIGVYDCSHYPRVQSGEITERQAFEELLQNFSKVETTGEISLEEWIDYYAAVSNSIEEDEHFVQLLKSSWRLQEAPDKLNEDWIN